MLKLSQAHIFLMCIKWHFYALVLLLPFINNIKANFLFIKSSCIVDLVVIGQSNIATYNNYISVWVFLRFIINPDYFDYLIYYVHFTIPP